MALRVRAGPQSNLGTMKLLAGIAEDAPPPGAKYHVMLSSPRRDTPPTGFYTSTFRGNERQADLEDAFEWGNFDTVTIDKLRSAFGPREAGRLLRDVVEDLCWEHSPWLIIDADKKRLVVHREWDCERIGGRAFVHFTGSVWKALRYCGFALKPAKRQGHSSYFEVHVDLGPVKQLWAFPGLRQCWSRNMRKDFLEFEADTVLVRDCTDAEVARAATFGKGLLRLRDLVSVLHEARIDTIERQLRR